MSAPLTLQKRKKIVYPETDGQPMAENTLQFRWIVTIEGNLEALYADDPNVFVAGDLFWYPAEGEPGIRTAPDILVVFGRPKGDRGSYMQWEEENVAPQVVWEIWSPGNRPIDLVHKRDFFEKYGVEEFYIYDPDREDLSGFRRNNQGILEEIREMNGWISPRLGIRFMMEKGEFRLYRPDGRPFHTFLEIMQQREEAVKRAEQESTRAEQEATRAEQEAKRAEQEAKRAEQEAKRAAAAEAEVARLRALLDKSANEK